MQRLRREGPAVVTVSVTKEQAQMLTALAIACRPYRAPTWDADGVMAAIAQVSNRPLSEVALAVIRAAADREAKTPGVIPSNGSHWQEQLKPARWEPTAGPWCGICGRAKAGHPDSDHPFERPADRRLPAEQVASVVSELRDYLTPTRGPEPLRERTHDPRADEARAALHPRPTRDVRAIAKALVHPKVHLNPRHPNGLPLRIDRVHDAMRRFRPGQPLTWPTTSSVSSNGSPGTASNH